jgi:hypothetical protein
MLIYILIFFFIIVTAFLLFNLRLSIRLSKEDKILFAGLGQSGSEFDFSSKKGSLKLFGLNLKQFDLTKKEKKPKEKKEEKKKRKRKSKRTRSVKDALKLLPQTFTAFKNFMVSIFKSIVVEELDGELEAGFASPHITGYVYGYYQAVSAIVPSFSQRFTFSPVWEKSSFDGQLNASFSLPLYKLLFKVIIFITSLPLRKIFVFVRGKKKGGQNGR